MWRLRRRTLSVVLAAGCLACAGPSQDSDVEQEQASLRFAFVTSGDSAFWDLAEAGATAAGRELAVDVQVHLPTQGLSEQNQILSRLLSEGIDGVAVSPMDPDHQTRLLNDLANRVPLITHDSDAPESGRLSFVGIDNYSAGRLCGQLVKEALPDGGTVAILVGRLEQLNAQQRRQGLIDELLDRPVDEDKRAFERFFPAQRYAKTGKVEGDRFTVVATYTDGFDFEEAARQVAAAVTAHPDLDAMVGLFSYNVPVALGVLEEMDRLDEIRLVAFDEDDETLHGIENGAVFGTVVQNPYRYGYESIRLLGSLAAGDRSVLPEGGFLDVPARRVTRENVVEFRNELRALLGGD